MKMDFDQKQMDEHEYLLPICALVRLDGTEYQIEKTRYFVPYDEKTNKQILKETRINKLRKLNGKKLINFDPIYKII